MEATDLKQSGSDVEDEEEELGRRSVGVEWRERKVLRRGGFGELDPSRNELISGNSLRLFDKIGGSGTHEAKKRELGVLERRGRGCRRRRRRDCRKQGDGRVSMDLLDQATRKMHRKGGGE